MKKYIKPTESEKPKWTDIQILRMEDTGVTGDHYYVRLNLESWLHLRERSSATEILKDESMLVKWSEGVVHPAPDVKVILEW